MAHALAMGSAVAGRASMVAELLSAVEHQDEMHDNHLKTPLDIVGNGKIRVEHRLPRLRHD